jgi:RND family efflux transporter MFP subunit
MKVKFFQYQWLIAVIVIFAAYGISLAFQKTAPVVETAVAEVKLAEFEVVELKPQTVTIPILTQGIVEPRTKIKVLSGVNGEITSAAANWVNGGFFKKGEILLQVEDYYYQNQLARAKATLAQAKSGLVQEEGFSYVAKQEWEKRNADVDNTAAKALALREPQLESMKAQHEAASADVVSAQNFLEKTKISAPFDGVVANKVVDVGQAISTGMAVADLYAIDVVEIRVPLTESQQAFLDLPTLNQTTKIVAKAKYNSQNAVVDWNGYLVRTEGVLDPVTKVLNGVVQIKDPYGLNKTVKNPLRLGAFVEVEIQGKKIENIFVIPRRLLYTGDVIWLVDASNKLHSQAVKVLPVRDDNVYIYEGVKAGDKMVAEGAFGLIDGKLVKPILVKEIVENETGKE